MQAYVGIKPILHPWNSGPYFGKSSGVIYSSLFAPNDWFFMLLLREKEHANSTYLNVSDIINSGVEI